MPMTPTIALLTDSVTAAAALAAGRAVTRAGAYSAAGGYSFGATLSSAAAAGDLTPVVVIGTAEVEAGAAVADGDLLMADAQGRYIPQTGTNKPIARALGAASGAGVFFEALLIPN